MTLYGFMLVETGSYEWMSIFEKTRKNSDPTTGIVLQIAQKIGVAFLSSFSGFTFLDVSLYADDAATFFWGL